MNLIGSSAGAEAAERACGGFCLYVNDDFEGDFWGSGPEPAWGCHNVPAAYNNKASSMKNPFHAKVLFHDSKNCTGTAGYTAQPESQDKDLTNNGFDDKTSLIKYVAA
ncbi:peptidase inhibitor family I36 protein [Streptomyces sp. NPDC096132]|uniref:peptidase inhibitor family I36 protein n=1 Tax=Streptomyces sp. NPDC096132 TaxID=3366075 RepID=UPI003825DDA0